MTTDTHTHSCADIHTIVHMCACERCIGVQCVAAGGCLLFLVVDKISSSCQEPGCCNMWFEHNWLTPGPEGDTVREGTQRGEMSERGLRCWIEMLDG